jgi:N-glycosidase YbiA
MPIYFYSARETPYGCFSNFSKHGFELEGMFWKTSEHYFQAQKFQPHLEHVKTIQRAFTPKDAANLGRERSRPLRTDWEEVKDDIMRLAVLTKFETSLEIAQILLETENEELVENTTGDHYWGCGSTGTGKNMLGIILMETREILRSRLERKT